MTLSKIPQKFIAWRNKKKQHSTNIFATNRLRRFHLKNACYSNRCHLYQLFIVKEMERKKRCLNFNSACMWDREMRLAVSAEQDDLDAWLLLCYRSNSCQIVKVVSINIWAISICGPKELNYPNLWLCIVLCPLTANWCKFNISKLVIKKTESKSQSNNTLPIEWARVYVSANAIIIDVDAFLHLLYE